MKLRTSIAIVIAGCGAATVAPPSPYDPVTTQLTVPANYRSWQFVTSGYQMGYGPAALAAAAGGVGAYDTVFVEPAAYHAFEHSGVWPDRTTFVLEVRTGEGTGSIVTTGHYQTDVLAVEAETKDARAPGGWAFFQLDATTLAGKPLPAATTQCLACHSKNGAVENTFVQFYPTLLPIARAHGTVRTDFVGIPPNAADLFDVIAAQGWPAGREMLDETVARWPEATLGREVTLDRIGHRLEQERHMEQAIDVFTDIVRRFPDSANAKHSLSEAQDIARTQRLAK